MTITKKKARYMAITITVLFLMIHVLMIILFADCAVTPMIRVNVFSILFYVAMLYVTYKEWFAFFAPAVYLEVVIHMSLAVIYTGWGHGFEITLIGMVVLAFYGEYVGRALKIRYTPMLPFCLLGMFFYLGTFIYEHNHPAPYALPERAAFALSIIWGVIVFVIIIAVQ